MKYLAALVIWIGLMTSSQAFADKTPEFGLLLQVPYEECQQAHSTKNKIVIPDEKNPSVRYILEGNAIYELKLDWFFDQGKKVITLKCNKYFQRN